MGPSGSYEPRFSRTNCCINWLKISPNLWTYSDLISQTRQNLLQYKFDNHEPVDGSAEAFQLNHSATLADHVTRLVEEAATTLDPRLHKMLAHSDHVGASANRRRHVTTSKAFGFRVSPARIWSFHTNTRHLRKWRRASSESDAAGLLAKLEGFLVHTLLLVEEFAKPRAR